jgi:Protein of unknown function (DUF2939)
MRKPAATILILVVVWLGYTAWPLYDLSVLVHAIETRDIDTVTRHVYFDAGKSVTSQIIAAYPRRTGAHISPLAQSMAAAALAIADPVVNKLISPEALSELLAVGWPVAVLPDPPPGTVGITPSTIGSVWQIFGNSEYGRQVRGNGSRAVTGAAALRPHVPAPAVALAIGRRHSTGQYSKLACG